MPFWTKERKAKGLGFERECRQFSGRESRCVRCEDQILSVHAETMELQGKANQQALPRFLPCLIYYVAKVMLPFFKQAFLSEFLKWGKVSGEVKGFF